MVCKSTLVGISEPAKRGEVVLDEVFTVVRKFELASINADRCFGRFRVVSILQQF